MGKNMLLAWLSMLAICGFVSCSDDDKPDVPGAKVVSITKEDFQQKVVGRTWKIIETTFVKGDGTVAADDIYFLVGGGLNKGFLFMPDEFRHYYETVGMHWPDGPSYYITDSYSFDQSTGWVTLGRENALWSLDDKADKLFYIESVTDDRLTVRVYYGWEEMPGNFSPEAVNPQDSYRRDVYIPLTAAEEAEYGETFKPWTRH